MIVVFAGAGASKAVSDEQYPTTVEFFDRLPQDIKQHQLFLRLAEILKTQEPSGPLDIERVLWALDDLRKWCKQATDIKSIVGCLLGSNHLRLITQHQLDSPQFVTMLSFLTGQIEALESEIHKRVYEYYAEQPTEDMLRDNWIPLLSQLCEHDSPVEVVTTNYDLVIEQAISQSEVRIATGRVTKGAHTFIEASTWILPTKADSMKRANGTLTKLHGSVDWIKVKNRVHCGTPKFTGDHKDHMILYPGYKGVPVDEPFVQMHQYFADVMSKSSAILFIGYAFRDRYINDLLIAHCSKTANVVVINPQSSLGTVPFPPHRLKHIKAGFSEESVSEAISALSSTART